MLWLPYAIGTRFLWAICNLIDQYIARYFAGPAGVGAAAMLQNLLALPVILVLLAVTGVPALPPAQALLWLAAGALFNGLALLPYLRAVQIDDAHNAMPLFETVPVLVIALSWLFFGETMHPHQIAGALLVIATGVLFLWDHQEKRLKLPTVLLMLASSFLYALYQLCLRPASLAATAPAVTIYFLGGIFLMGLVMGATHAAWRAALVRAIRESRGRILAVNMATNGIWCLSLLTLSTAMARAPGAGFVAALSGTQPVFVLGLSWLAGLTGSPHYRRLSWHKELKFKLLLLPPLIAGIALLRL